MEETYLVNVEGVKKKILHGGYGELPEFKDGSKVTFHFQTLKDDFERTVIDDSRVAGTPMEIIVGKMFKIEIWETLLTSMRIGEVAEFWCDAVHTGMYALVSKGMRKIAEGKDPLDGQKHRCGMGNMFDYHSTGYGDLDELQRTPQPLIFIMELFKVEDPSSYKRDTWAMSNDEKLAAVPQLHTEGNRLVLARKFKEAAEKYQEAIICLRNVQAKAKPWDEDWLKLEKLITPLVLNYCQCQLELGEYYEVLEHTTDLLQKNNKNVKAYFKRAKAHSAVWNEKEARVDFLRAAQLDPSLAAAVRKELKLLGERMRRKHVEDRKRYQGLFQQPSKAKTEAGKSEGAEELSEEKEEQPDFIGHRAEVEESNKGNVWKSELKAEEMKKNGETEGEKEGKEELMVKLGERGEEDCFSQSEGEKMKIEVGNNQEEEQGHGRGDSYSRDELTGCETSEEKQLGVTQRESKEEKENAGVGRDIQTEEEERRAIYGKTPGQVAESMTNSTEEGSPQGRQEGLEEVTSTKEGENEEANCGTGEVTTGAQRVQNILCFGPQNFKEQDRKSFKEVSKGNCFEVQNDASKGGARLATELNFEGERSSEQEVCGWSWKERAIREKEVHLEGTELQKFEAEANQVHHGGNAEDHPLASGDGVIGAGDEAETRLRMENSREERQNSSKEAEHGKEGMKPGSGSEIPEAMTRPEGLETKMNSKLENLEMGRREDNPETDQADLPIS